MYAPQKSNHWFWRHCAAIFGSDDDFAFVLGAAEEEAKCVFDLFLGCEFLYDIMECFVVVESEDEDSSEVGFGIVQGCCLFLDKTENIKYKRVQLEQKLSL